MIVRVALVILVLSFVLAGLALSLARLYPQPDTPLILPERFNPGQPSAGLNCYPVQPSWPSFCMAEYILPTPLRRVYIMADAGMITYTSFAIDGVRLGDLYLWLGPPDHIQRYKGGAAIYWSSPPAVARMYTSGSAIKVDLLRQVHFMALINPG